MGSIVTASCVAGCGSDDDAGFSRDLSGDYSVNVTNGPSSCEQDWTEGETSTGIPFTIDQEGDSVTGRVEGGVAVLLALVIGTNEFEGTIDGNAFSMVAYGTIPRVEGNCTYTLNATLEGSIHDDAVEGSIVYAPATNSNPDCDAVECSSVQNFTGSRPPR